MEDNKKPEETTPAPNDDMGMGNISEKELNRDLINLHLPEIDLIGDGDFEKTRKEMMERYGDDFYDDDDSEEESEEGSEEKGDKK